MPNSTKTNHFDIIFDKNVNIGIKGNIKLNNLRTPTPEQSLSNRKSYLVIKLHSMFDLVTIRVNSRLITQVTFRYG